METAFSTAMLTQALERAGDEARLAQRLRVESPELARWLSGDGTPPLETLMDVLDLLTC